MRDAIAGIGSAIAGAHADASNHAAGALSTATLAAEGKTIGRAFIASVAATAVDGVAYYFVITLVLGRYGVASAAGAVAGAVTNFVLQRNWVFRAKQRHVATQLALYALGSAATWASLQAALWVLVEQVHLDAKLAWPPAKAFAWIAVSYPLSRAVVFAEPRT